MFVESLVAAFLLGVFLGAGAIHLFYAHLHETRREIARVDRETLGRIALREAFVAAVRRAEGEEAARGVERKLRVVRK